MKCLWKSQQLGKWCLLWDGRGKGGNGCCQQDFSRAMREAALSLRSKHRGGNAPQHLPGSGGSAENTGWGSCPALLWVVLLGGDLQTKPRGLLTAAQRRRVRPPGAGVLQSGVSRGGQGGTGRLSPCPVGGSLCRLGPTVWAWGRSGLARGGGGAMTAASVSGAPLSPSLVCDHSP